MRHRVLVLCGDQYHPADLVMTGLGALGNAEFEFEHAPDGPVASLDPGLSLIILAKSNVCSKSDLSPWAGDETDELLSAFVRGGKGMLVLHAGTVAYGEARAIRGMTGGAFQHHPEPCEVTMELGGEHPVTAGVGPFSVHDEHYFVEFDEGQDLFLRSHSENGIQPAGWAKSFGQGRVCVITPGHFAGVWAHPEFQKLLRNALGWVAHG